MIHEPYMRFSANPLYSAASLIHRLMLFVAGSASDRIWLSTPAWAPLVRPYLPRRPVQWLPVPVPPAQQTNISDVAEVRTSLISGAGPLVGHFSSHSTILAPILVPAIGHVLRSSLATIALIGHNGGIRRTEIPNARPEFTDRIRATGDLDRTALSAHLQACDVMLQPYPDGITARRMSTITLLAHGCPVVTNMGELTEPFWSNGGVRLVAGSDPKRIAAAVVDLLANVPQRTTLGERGLERCKRVFDVRHTIAALTGPEHGQVPDGDVATAS